MFTLTRLLISLLFVSSVSGQEHYVLEVLQHDQAIGQAVVIDKQPDGQGYAATALHVVDDLNDFRVRYHDGSTAKHCRVVARFPDGDLAIIHVYVPASVDPVKIAEPSESVTLINRLRERREISRSIVQNHSAYFDGTAEPGDSGSGVFNDSGQLVGIVSGGWFWLEGTKQTWPIRTARLEPVCDWLKGR